MALQIISKTTPNSASNPNTNKAKKLEFEERLKKMSGIKFKEKPVQRYTAWRMFCNYIVIRTYSSRYTVHTNGDIEHYEMKEGSYDKIDLSLNDFEFFKKLLEE